MPSHRGLTGGSATGSWAVQIGPSALRGEWTHVPRSLGLVVFAHGVGSNWHSPRNREVAQVLQAYGFDTLLFDLLTDDETAAQRPGVDVALHCLRLIEALAWARDRLHPAQIALFGADTGAAAALCAAAKHPSWVSAVVSRGGRPDLAGAALLNMQAPILFVVGGLDTAVLACNRQTLQMLPGRSRLEVVPGAGHLFEEAGALETVAHLSATWLQTRLRTPAGA